AKPNAATGLTAPTLHAPSSTHPEAPRTSLQSRVASTLIARDPTAPTPTRPKTAPGQGTRVLYSTDPESRHMSLSASLLCLMKKPRRQSKKKKRAAPRLMLKLKLKWMVVVKKSKRRVVKPL
ncbi:hypothetical protein HDV05_007441, partial [Chytridiales sp. JEL 0842]